MPNQQDVLISQVKLRGNQIIRPDTYTTILERHKPKPIPVTPRVTIWGKIKTTIKLSSLLVQLIFVVIRIRISLMSNDLKTTVAGCVKVLFLGLTVFGVNTGHITEALVTTALYAVAELVQAWYTNKK